jgi:hypothetical protein
MLEALKPAWLLSCTKGTKSTSSTNKTSNTRDTSFREGARRGGKSTLEASHKCPFQRVQRQSTAEWWAEYDRRDSELRGLE